MCIEKQATQQNIASFFEGLAQAIEQQHLEEKAATFFADIEARGLEAVAQERAKSQRKAREARRTLKEFSLHVNTFFAALAAYAEQQQEAKEHSAYT